MGLALQSKQEEMQVLSQRRMLVMSIRESTMETQAAAALPSVSGENDIICVS